MYWSLVLKVVTVFLFVVLVRFFHIFCAVVWSFAAWNKADTDNDDFANTETIGDKFHHASISLYLMLLTCLE